MDRTPEQLKSMGVFGIYKEAFKLTASWKKLFTQITLTFILPLSVLYLSQIQITDLFNDKINHNQDLQRTNSGTPGYYKAQDRISSLRTTYWIINAIYNLLIVIYSLLSISAVAYAITSIYSSNDVVTFRKLMSAVPRLCTRLISTILWTLLIIILYTGVAVALGFLILTVTVGPNGDSQTRANVFYVLISVLALFYLIGLVYMLVVFSLASVISVLEKGNGFKALKKGRNLIKGKLWVASAIFVMLDICFSGLLVGFTYLIFYGNSVATVGKVFLGIFCYLLLTILFHILLATQTIIYFVCKAKHNENIDRTGRLAEHRESFIRLNGNKDVQLGQVPV